MVIIPPPPCGLVPLSQRDNAVGASPSVYIPEERERSNSPILYFCVRINIVRDDRVLTIEDGKVLPIEGELEGVSREYNSLRARKHPALHKAL